ncbi:hypothetical protein AcV7_005672 [Taiwanofungus camphoratus]|nr:hypothetical protein AcV7_005672 [Antrodia cinnamomea]
MTSNSACHSLASIQFLPAELTELILIFAAASGFPTAIANLAQTCRAFHALVYHSSDQHLWREVFLTTFDDPRVNAEWHAQQVADNPGVNAKNEPDKDYNWGAEFMRRIWTSNYIRNCTNPRWRASVEATRTSDSLTSLENNTCALETLVSTVRSALPCPPTIVFSFLSTSDSTSVFDGGAGLLGTRPAYPIFPPQPHTFLSSHRGSDADSSAARPTSRPVTYPSSRNIAWFETVLKRGLPPALTALLSGDTWKGGIMGQLLSERETRMMQALGRVVCYTGFIPASPPEETEETASESASKTQTEDEDIGADHNEQGEEESGMGWAQTHEAQQSAAPSERIGDPVDFITGTRGGDVLGPATASPDMSVAAQNRRARRLARMRVYNMRYLTPKRHWGPFLPITSPPPSPSHGGVQTTGRSPVREEDELLEPILALFAGVRNANTEHHVDDEDGSISDDDEAIDTGGSDNESASAAGAFNDDRDHTPWHGQRSSDTPHPSLLRPDWAYLAAVRLVVEANLREAVTSNELSGLVWLDGLRKGSAPVDMGAGASTAKDDAEIPERLSWRTPKQTEEEKEKGRAKGRSFEAEEGSADGYDWAGVTGIWRRCICWMDYRDLILHNLSSEFNDPHLQEAVRIVPMRLRVASYSPSPIPIFGDRPTIHVVGETSGSSPSGQVRRVRGTVSVIADGSVRWTLYSSVDGGDADEWVSEGVQVGGVTSAMGVLGIWTGAYHERMDPIGPSWAWKVG